MEIKTRKDLIPSKRKTPLYNLSCLDLIKYDGPCIITEGDKDWEWRVLDAEFERMINLSDCSEITIEDLNTNPWIKIIERKYNGQIRTYGYN